MCSLTIYMSGLSMLNRGHAYYLALANCETQHIGVLCMYEAYMVKCHDYMYVMFTSTIKN